MPTPLTVTQTRAVPIEPRQAFAQTLPLPLPTIFCRRYALLPPVSEVRGQHGHWGMPGQSRTVVTSDGGTMHELLLDVDAPRSFSYRLSDITGPLRPLITSVDGRWEFAPCGTGTMITWRWTLHPTPAGVIALPVVRRMWPGYARQALEQLSGQLLAGAAAGNDSN